MPARRRRTKSKMKKTPTMPARRRRSIKSIISVASILMLAQPAAAQLRSVGPVPQDLKQSVQELYDADLQRAKEYTGGRVRDRQQLLEASYNVNKMLSSGHILYGDPITQMLNRIADTLTAGYPELRGELRFYTVTSSDVNAYATPQGMVFVTTGLVAQVENEAQLAFILSHEIVHYYRSHGMEELVGKKARKRSSEDLDDEAERAGEFIHRHNRSRAMENEADSLGIAMFYLGSPYTKDISEGVFDVLQYSELPFDEIAFDTTWFNTPYYTLDGCWLAEVADITSRDNYDDSRSTHPNILSRRQHTAAWLDGYYGGERYVVTTKAEFETLRRMARLECIRQDLLHGNYAKAFYNSWVMQRKESSDAVDRYMVQALYGLATFKNNSKLADVLPDYKKIEGESQQVYYAAKTMSAEQMTLAALHKAWEMHLRHPDDKAYTAISADLMEQLRTQNGKASPDYLAQPPTAAQTAAADSAAAQQKPEEDENLTKYERIKQKRQTQTQRKPTAYALTDLMMQDATLQPILRDHLNGTAKKAATTDAAVDSAGMLVFNPSYWVVDSRKDQQEIVKSVNKEGALGDRVARTAEREGRRAIDFSDKAMHEMDSADEYNDFLTICEWMNEFWLSKGKFDLVRVMQPAMDELLDRHGARTLNMTAVLNIENQKADLDAIYFLAVPLIPLEIASAIGSTVHTTMVGLVVDAREGKLLTRQVYNAGIDDTPSAVDAMLYDTYRKAMNPLKKEPVGHMGHRLSVTGGISLGPSGKQPWGQLKKYVALTPWAAVEFVVGRKASIFASARYQKAYEGVTRIEGRYEEGTGSYAGYTVYNEYRVPSSMDMLTITAGGRLYSQSEFAPLGKYVCLEAMMTHYSMPFEGGSPESDNTFGIGFGIGQNYIFLNRIVLNYEVDYAWNFGYLSSRLKEFGSTADNPKVHRADGLVSNLLTLRLGIGFIPF